MTTWSTHRALCLSLFLGLLCGTAQAQEDSPPIEEGMLRSCPELKTAGPRERRQLIALFFDLDPSSMNAKAAEKTRSLFDLKAKKDAKVLERYLDARGIVHCVAGLKAVFRAHGAAGQLWLLERYVKAQPARKGRLLSLLAVFDELETWRLLIKLLDDKTPVPDPHAAQIAPPDYQDLRVCDYALRTLGGKLARLKTVKLAGKRASRNVHSTMPIPARDRRVAALIKQLAASEAFKTHLTGCGRLVDAVDAGARGRTTKVLTQLGVDQR